MLVHSKISICLVITARQEFLRVFLLDCCVLWAFQNQQDQNYTVLKTKSNMMTVEGLKPGTTYVFRVRARTNGGYGSYSGEIELETSQEGNFTISLLFSLDLSSSISFSCLLCCCHSAFTGKILRHLRDF